MSQQEVDVLRVADEDAQMRSVEQTLLRQFEGVPKEQVCASVSASRATFADARVRTFVPVLVQREAAQELRRVTSEPS